MSTRALVIVTCLSFAACGPGSRSGDDDGTGGGTADGQLEEGSDNTPRILMLDFRSGWWAGSQGEFHKSVLAPLATTGSITIEFHHLTVGQDIKCIYEPYKDGVCETVMMADMPTAMEIIARFDRHMWNSYNQVWILSGSEADPSDVRVTGDLFGTFLGQGTSSCNSLFIGAGDGFIDHGNAIAQRLGMGQILSTEYVAPNFFVSFPGLAIDSRMAAGMQMDPHPLFDGVNMIADGVSSGINPFLKHSHGDSIVANPLVQVIAHDSAGRPAIGLGEITLPNGDKRPFVIDAGMQRYYGLGMEADTLALLKNIRKYLASVGCNPVFE